MEYKKELKLRLVWAVCDLILGITMVVPTASETIRKQELSEKDERYQMLSERARSWAFSLYITLAGVAVIVLNLLGHAQTALPYAWSICGLLILYSGSWHFLQKKY